MDNIEKLKNVFTEALSLEADTDFDTLAYRENPKWDSLAHMQLVGILENEFDIMLDTEDVIAMSSFPVAIELLGKYGVEFD